MAISTAISRFVDYYQRHGFAATLRRMAMGVKRSLSSGRSVLFYCDLATQTAPPRDLPSFLRVERKKSFAELSPEDLEAMGSVWNPKLVQQVMKERFGLGASAWLIKSRDKLAGYGWTLQGRTVEPHYFPLGQDDVQFIDFHVFPKFRGRAIDWFLMTQILRQLAADGIVRAYGESGEWNEASMASFKMASFRHLGVAKKWTIFGRTNVWWTSNESLPRVVKSEKNEESRG
jgi:ribosomal protein S18 acetylase RimI-like enzyme